MQNQDLKKVGLKVTLPRMRILEILETSDNHHMNAEDVYRALIDSGEDIGLATVYRVLNQFEAAGLVMRHHFSEGGQAVYELARGPHHDHLVCINCGKVVEFVDETIEARQRRVADNMGFRIEDHSLIIHAECIRQDCPNAKIN